MKIFLLEIKKGFYLQKLISMSQL